MVPEINGGLAPVLSHRGVLSLFLIKLTEVSVLGEEEEGGDRREGRGGRRGRGREGRGHASK